MTLGGIGGQLPAVEIRPLGHRVFIAVGAIGKRSLWLGREGSNLRIAESKAAGSAVQINGNSEKHRKFDHKDFNTLHTASECDFVADFPNVEGTDTRNSVEPSRIIIACLTRIGRVGW
jgi:hypothetical protein